MISNHFQRAMGSPGALSPLPGGAVHPPSLTASLSDLRVSPMELQGEFIRLFVSDYEKVDQEKDKRLHMLGKIIAETMSVHAAATELLATHPWDFAAIYYSGIDHFERVRVESDEEACQPQLGSPVADAAQQIAMSQVHTVKGADSDYRA